MSGIHVDGREAAAASPTIAGMPVIRRRSPLAARSSSVIPTALPAGGSRAPAYPAGANLPSLTPTLTSFTALAAAGTYVAVFGEVFDRGPPQTRPLWSGKSHRSLRTLCFRKNLRERLSRFPGTRPLVAGVADDLQLQGVSDCVPELGASERLREGGPLSLSATERSVPEPLRLSLSHRERLERL